MNGLIELDAEGLAYLASITPVFSTSVDRLDQVPQRLRQLFEFSPQSAVAQPEIRSEIESDVARGVIAALAEELGSAPRLLDRQTFRSVADRVRQKTGQKGRALFHPIRIALTTESDGPELDLLVPAIDRAAALDPSSGLAPIVGCRERAQRFLSVLG